MGNIRSVFFRKVRGTTMKDENLQEELKALEQQTGVA